MDAFKKYVNAYLTIMETNKKKYGWKTLYFDGFAGSGDLNKRGNDNTETDSTVSFLNLDIEETGTQVYKGAAERVLNLTHKFDYYYFVDLNKESLDRLEEKLRTFDMGPKLQFRPGDANVWIKELAAALKKDTKLKALVLLDPFGMQINWESIELLKDTASDGHCGLDPQSPTETHRALSGQTLFILRYDGRGDQERILRQKS